MVKVNFTQNIYEVKVTAPRMYKVVVTAFIRSGPPGLSGNLSMQQIEYTGTGTENNRIIAPGISNSPWVLIFQSTKLRRYSGVGAVPENRYRINAGDEVEFGNPINAGDEIDLNYQISS